MEKNKSDPDMKLRAIALIDEMERLDKRLHEILEELFDLIGKRADIKI